VSPSFWGSSTWADHIDHIHMAVGNMVKGVAATVRKLKQVVMTGPDGAFKDLGQGVFDKLISEGNKYLAKHAPTQGAEGLMPGFKGGRTVAASWYGSLSTQGPHPIGAGGVPMRGNMFAELDMGTP